MENVGPDVAHPENRLGAEVVAVCISAGGIPKQRVESARLTTEGLVGDGHDHQKHCRPDRAVSIQDVELLDELKAEGYEVGPGIMGENLTVRGLNVQGLAPGDQLCFDNGPDQHRDSHGAGGPVLELTEPRRPCFVLDQIDPSLQGAVVGRCGFLAKVLRNGSLYPGQHIAVQTNEHD